MSETGIGVNELHPLDWAWLLLESSRTPMHVGCLQVFSAPPDRTEHRLFGQAPGWRGEDMAVPPWNWRLQRPRWGRPCWVEDAQIDLEYHLQDWALPQSHKRATLNQLLGRLHEQPLDTQRPLWECHRINNLAPARVGVYFKLHHALVDGVGGVRLLQRLLQQRASETQPHPPWARSSHPQGHVSTASTTRSAWQRIGHELGRELREVPDVTGALAQLAKRSLHQAGSDLSAPFASPSTVFNTRVSNERAVARTQWSLSRLQDLAHRFHCSVNDVLLSVCGGALRRYLAQHASVPPSSLTAGVPVSLRKQGDLSTGSALSFMVAALHTEMADPEQRLSAVTRSTRAAKAHLKGMRPQSLPDYTLLLMAPAMVEMLSGLAGRLRPPFNVVISNIPGPSAPLYDNGARLEAVYPSSIVTDGQALNITAMSYAGRLFVGLTACARAVPHLDQIAQAMDEELEVLEDLTPRLGTPGGLQCSA